MIELKPCTKTEHEDCPHLSIRKCCDVSRMHFCMKWRMNRAKDGIIHACEEPKETDRITIFEDRFNLLFNNHKHNENNKELTQKIAQMESSTLEMEKVIDGLQNEHTNTLCELLKMRYELNNVRDDREKIKERKKLIETECIRQGTIIQDLSSQIQSIINTKNQEIARLEGRLYRSIENNGLDKQARINVLAEEVRKKDRQIAAQKMTIDAQAAAIKEWVEDEKKRIKPNCETCRHDTIPAMDEPCRTCWGVQPPFKRWEPIVKECPTCKYFPDHVSSSTCYKCLSINTPFALWVPK